jgi:hypothetical protein
MALRRAALLTALLAVAALPPAAAAACADPLPLDPAVVTREMGLKAFGGANQAGPVCHLSWQAKSGPGPSLLVYGPSWLEKMGQKSASAKQAAERYRAESPKGVEPVPGLQSAYMVFDPKTPNRRVFVERSGKVYMIISSDAVPLAVLAKAAASK